MRVKTSKADYRSHVHISFPGSRHVLHMCTPKLRLVMDFSAGSSIPIRSVGVVEKGLKWDNCGLT